MKSKIRAMATDELWQLHSLIRKELIHKMKLQMEEISGRLDVLVNSKSDPLTLLSMQVDDLKPERPRRPYPKPAPKFRNPDDPSQTWAGRGLRPRWLTAQVKAGKKIEDFRIVPSKTTKKGKTTR